MLELVNDFTGIGELVVDPYAGEACILSGRKFLGCELKASKAARANERLLATIEGSNIQAREAGQLALMGAAR
jgi:DNA modification methylase